MRLAIIVSVVVHVGVVVWAAAGDDASLPELAIASTDPYSEPPIADPIAAIAPIDEPIQIVLLSDAVPVIEAASVAARLHTPSRSRAEESSGSVALESSASPSASTEVAILEPSGHGEPVVTPRDRSPFMTMRRRDLRELPDDFVGDFLAHSKPPAEVPDLPGARIDAEIADIRDRLKHARDGADLSGDRARLVALNEARSHVELRRNRDGTYSTTKRAFAAKVDRDGTIHIHDRPNVQFEGPGLSFDVTDAMMRRHGIDPYSSAKLRLMDRTRDQRVAIGQEYRREQLSHSAELMQANVQRAWTMTSDLHARKQGLFELWDECAETGEPEVIAGGDAARDYVIRFIQVKLTGANAYTPDELGRLNAGRHSKAVFAPYAR